MDRLDREFSLKAEEGETISATLHRNHIPPEAVVLRVNGQISDVYTTLVETDRDFRVQMVRAYLLPDLLKLLGVYPSQTAPKDSSAFYSKPILWFNEDGECEVRIASCKSAHEFVQKVEEDFIAGIQQVQLIRGGDSLGLALSGGRDSLALCYLLSRLQDKCPAFLLHSATVASMAVPGDVNFAEEVAKQFDVPHHTISEEEARARLRLNRSVQDTLRLVKDKKGRAVAIYGAPFHSLPDNQLFRITRNKVDTLWSAPGRSSSRNVAGLF